ncbi:FtsQ-type POTRA domain-containing protein [Actinospica acidiphila]|uniref:Cell division protein FtsQ n=2 Tax=Streptomyces TaxID=1883 RepID=A0ABP7XQM7_9ACTN|nr:MULTISPECIES: FtsQ-type POTRA domain-containing protein [Streptomyces]AXI86279.1 cell division protein FtsQ [Streptomyces sp. ETH9427]MBJ6616998.1 FtsQ-type POTRA domain-containing protein [Streptomyces sp. I3(2020)]NEA79433.1 FtsQ-type POTRA domain-containing protein [Actinospica acidiphila]MBJ6628330.1 FtsQ-type POTRA domain-containing protein [Streptomyces sp. I4(2020)]MCM2512573.1 FtsQ-type POTRA domain-containing protein [Streptomyces griseoincarnatus]
MAGSTTAERGERKRESSGPPPVRAVRRRRLRLIIASAVALLFFGSGAFWLLYGSDLVRVERVSVSGTGVLTPDQVREAAQVPLGEQLVSVDTGAIEKRAAEELPRIDTVDVVRSWPDEIKLRVTERTPVLLVHQGGKFVEVDDDGVRFATVEKAPKGVPALEMDLSRSGSSAASLRRFGEDRLVREAVRVAGAVPESLAPETRSVKVRSYDAISLELTDGRTVDWGSSEKGTQKARALTALMKAEPDARHFDVSVPSAPASSGS